VIVMGTPAGVGQARTPPVWMKAGDTIEIEIERVGLLSTHRRRSAHEQPARPVPLRRRSWSASARRARWRPRCWARRVLKVYGASGCRGLRDPARHRAGPRDHAGVPAPRRGQDAVAPHCEPFTPSEYFGVDGQLIAHDHGGAAYPQGYTPSIVFTQPPVERRCARVAQLPNVEVALGQRCGWNRMSRADGVRWRGTMAAQTRARALRDRLRRRLRAPCARARHAAGRPGLRRALAGGRRAGQRTGLAKLPKTSVQYCEPERPCTYVIGPGNHRRWEISLLPGEDPADGERRRAPGSCCRRWLTPEDGELWRQASYRFHALVAREWRKGRVFLAGDAAHHAAALPGAGHVPGRARRANLAWKLARRLWRRGERCAAR
jgi:hypothetical protein